MLEKSNFEKIVSVNAEHKKISDAHKKSNPVDYWLSDKKNAEDYFRPNNNLSKKIKNYFKKIHLKGEKVVYVDICGRANGEMIGADKSYSFSFLAPEDRRTTSEYEKEVFISGDILNSTDFARFIKKIKEDGTAPAFITFAPIAGLGSYSSMAIEPKKLPELYDEVTYAKFAKRLEDVVDILRPEGYLYFSGPFYDMDPALLAKNVKTIAQRLRCEVEVINNKNDVPYFLLRKGK